MKPPTKIAVVSTSESARFEVFDHSCVVVRVVTQKSDHVGVASGANDGFARRRV